VSIEIKIPAGVYPTSGGTRTAVTLFYSCHYERFA
jgi:hypothetical protein